MARADLGQVVPTNVSEDDINTIIDEEIDVPGRNCLSSHGLYYFGNKIKTKFPTFPISIANGGTGANSKAGAIENLGLKGVEKRVLLGENASPTSRFDPQTVSLDLSGYDFLVIQHTMHNNDTRKFVTGIECVNNLYFQLSTTQTTDTVPGNVVVANRSCRVRTNGVQFEDCGYVHDGGTAVANLWNIPHKIGGIKEA